MLWFDLIESNCKAKGGLSDMATSIGRLVFAPASKEGQSIVELGKRAVQPSALRTPGPDPGH